MNKEPLTFNDLPQVVAELRDEVSGMKALLLNLQNRPTQQRENRHRPLTPEQVAEKPRLYHIRCVVGAVKGHENDSLNTRLSVQEQ